MATDMATMKQLRDGFTEHLTKQGLLSGDPLADNLLDTTDNETIEQSKQVVTNIILHACDISTSLRPFETSLVWAEMIFKEFFH